MVLLWGFPSIKAGLDKSKVVIPVTGLDNMIVKKVSKPEDGLQKIAVVNTEIDKLIAALPKTDEKAGQDRYPAGRTEKAWRPDGRR